MLKPTSLTFASALLLSLLLAGCSEDAVAVEDGGSEDAGHGDGSSPTRDGGGPGDAGAEAAVEVCGDGIVNAGETCDDGNVVSGDGCSTCTIESGWTCGDANPSVCVPTCGDGIVVGDEAGPNGCDDGNKTAGDGCSESCVVEQGFSCAGAPSVCSPGCGDGLVVGSELCDDGNLVDGDGCSAACMIESGFACSGVPSVCASICGDGIVAGAEVCDDGNVTTETECPYGTATCVLCDATCSTELNLTGAVCGDGVLDPGETCDDGYRQDGDGCSSLCAIENGFTCAGTPSRCSTTVAYAGAPVAVPDNGPTVDIPVTVAATCLISNIATTHRWEPNHTWAGDLRIELVGPDGTVAPLSRDQGGSSDLDGPYTFAPTGTPWPGAAVGGVIASDTYAAPALGNFISGRADGAWTLRVKDGAGADVGSVSEMSVTITCDPRPSLPDPGVRTCAEIHTADPLAVDGTYLIDPDGPGPQPSATVYCDMTGGGWTLVMASHSLGPSAQTVASTVLPGSGTYLPGRLARALATASTQVHVRSAGAAATRSITSVPETLPIQNLRTGHLLNADSPFRGASDDVSAMWTGPLAADASYLWHSCGVAPFGTVGSYPDIYWACNNGDGFHLTGAQGSKWRAADPDEDLEVYVR
ncbi:MAG: hypothetical protein BGO98_33570 [Myxococcales bacterium 68-20]|nr:DUF4215 domain-containing protein [Myxococcales bacterium]OJY22959.1 MAG: hypothetical protein BGO98_33570 [Myxococcales bacterium 68-20]